MGIEGDNWVLEVKISVNTTSTVFIPSKENNTILLDGGEIDNLKEIRFMGALVSVVKWF